MSFSTYSHISSRRGQTLVEALIALSILTVGFVGIVGLLNKSFQINRTTSNDTQATYLASEGIEVAKSIIDYDVYLGLWQSSGHSTGWGCSFSLTPGTPVDYALEYDTVAPACPALLPTMSSSPTGDKLFLIPTGPDANMYTYAGFGNQATNFTRDVWITAVSNDELDVQSIVTWADGGQSNTITLEDHFYNWHPTN